MAPLRECPAPLLPLDSVTSPSDPFWILQAGREPGVRAAAQHGLLQRDAAAAVGALLDEPGEVLLGVVPGGAEPEPAELPVRVPVPGRHVLPRALLPRRDQRHGVPGAGEHAVDQAGPHPGLRLPAGPLLQQRRLHAGAGQALPRRQQRLLLQPLRGHAHRLRPQQPDVQAAKGVRPLLLHRIAVPIPRSRSRSKLNRRHSSVDNQFLIVAESEPSSKSKGVIIGIAVGCGILFVALAGAAAYAFIQRRRAQKAKEELGGPFGMFCVMFSSSDNNIMPRTETDKGLLC